MLGLILLLLEGLALAFSAGAIYLAWNLTHPPRRTLAWAVARNRPCNPAEVRPGEPMRPVRFESWTLDAVPARLPIWDIAGDRDDGPLIIYTHGWGESRTVALARLPGLLALARRVILYDLAGHGEAGGTSSLGVREGDDLTALLDAAVSPGVATVLMGSSLGAGVSIVVAARDIRVAAVVAEAPYRLPQTPAARVLAARNWPHRVLLPAALAIIRVLTRAPRGWTRPAGPFDRAAHAAKLTCPLLVIHGSADAICPLADGQEIARAAPVSQFVEIPDAGHVDLWTDDRFRPRVRAALEAFLRQHLKKSR